MKQLKYLITCCLLCGLIYLPLPISAQGTALPDIVSSASWNSKEDTLLVVGRSGAETWGVWLYDADLHLRSMFPTADTVSVEWSPDGVRFSIGRDIVDSTTLEVLLTLNAASGIGGWSPDGEQVLAWADEKTLGLFNSKTGILARTIPVGNTPPDSVGWSPDGAFFALIQPTGATDIISAEDGHHVITIATDFASGLRWSPDSHYLAGTTLELVEPGTPGTLPNALSPTLASVVVWDIFTGTVVQKYTGLQASPIRLRWHPYKPELAGGTGKGFIYIWNIETGEQIERLVTLGELRSMEYSPFGGRLIVGAHAPMASLLASETSKRLQEPFWSQMVIPNTLEIIVPAPSVERLQAIAEACQAPPAVKKLLPATATQQQLSQFVTSLEALPAGTISPGCAADLIAVAQALQTEQS